MSRAHRLTGAEFRLWRQNVPQLVDAEGHAVRALLLAEEQLISELSERARQSAQAVSHTAEVHEADGSSRTVDIQIQVHEAHAQTPASPHHPNPVLLEIRVDGLTRKTARQVIGERLLAHYKNDVLLRSPNGKFLRMVRNPLRAKPTRTDADRTAPKPEFCECRKWGNPHPGRHHPVCPYNRFAPPHEQALSNLDIGPASAAVGTLAAKPSTGTITEQSLAEAPSREHAKGIVSDMLVHAPGVPRGKPQRAPEPEVCQCKDWKRPAGADPLAHHPICEFRLAYEREHAQAEAQKQALHLPWLMSLEGERVREATPNEIAEADAAEERTGLRTVQIDDIPYVVSSSTEDSPAAAEAERSVPSLAGDEGEGQEAKDPRELEAAAMRERVQDSLELPIDAGAQALGNARRLLGEEPSTEPPPAPTQASEGSAT